MSQPRFSFFPNPPSLLDHASRVKIELHKIRGRIGIDFEVEGSLWPQCECEDKGDSAECNCLTSGDGQTDPVEFARSLLSQFVVASKGGGN